jgi:transcriptional regulator with XRE-family HTH domain
MELKNQIIGRNLAKFRKMRDMKASDLAERIGMKEGAYTKYERGETPITVDFVQKVATALNVDPITILAASPDNFIESITSNTTNSGIGGQGIGNSVDIEGDYNAADKTQTELMMKMMEKLIELLGKK